MVDLEKIDQKISFDVKVQISLIKNAERIMDLYPNKKKEFEAYIEERKEKIRKMLGIVHDDIFENGKLLISL